jgi:RHS repeat-associated protein
MKEEASLGGIYDFNARMYDPAIGRFLSADTIVPDFANPQSLNRFSYVENRPLSFIDPTGHDAVFISGYNPGQDAQSPEMVAYWKFWIMAYKDWTEVQYEAFLGGYSSAKDRVQFAKDNGMLFYSYPRGSGSETISDVEVTSLSSQMEGMSNVVMIGHSNGANLTMQYMAAKHAGKVTRGPDVGAFILIKPPRPGSFQAWWGKAGNVGAPFSFDYESIMGKFDGSVVNSYSPTDIAGNLGRITGVQNVINNDTMQIRIFTTTHGRGRLQDAKNAFAALAVTNCSPACMQ